MYGFHGDHLPYTCNCVSLQEVYLVSEAEKRRWHPLPRSAYPKPLIFHDGRIAFRPTPISTVCMFLWLPLGIPLAISRAMTFIILPYAISIPILSFMGFHCRITTTSSSSPPRKLENSRKYQGQVYVCNHRTLLDPLYIAGMLQRHVTATTYSISRVSEFLSPIKTIRLTRNRKTDKARMESVLRDGDLVVCPEGTTCREPYLLRFSPLFAELISQEIVPVAMKVHVGMFHGTTASGFKGLDPLFCLMNPFPWCEIVFMEKLSTTSIHGKDCSSREVANYVQEKIGKVLGFECTALTRRDKYLMLAGNEGIIDREAKGS